MLTTIKYWLLALRLKTLPAAIAPVAIGLALAINNAKFHLPAAIITLSCSLLIQIGTNFANDYIDAQKGADTDQRKGPKRMVQAGLISLKHMKIATYLVFLTAFILGLYLVWLAGWPILAIGIISISCGYLYTAGPYALAYNGLGDLFALIFFGPVAIGGTYYIQTTTLSMPAIHLGIGIGLLSTALLTVNNIRDINEDIVVNKKTTVVRFGTRYGQIQYTLCILLSFSILALYTIHNLLIIYALVSYAIYSIHIIRKVWVQTGPQLNNCLATTGLCLVLYSLIACTAILY